MREYMPYTHADPVEVRRYAEGEASFDAIAEDRGPRRMSTLDAPRITDKGKILKHRPLTAEEKAKKKRLEEDARVYETQLREMQTGTVQDVQEYMFHEGTIDDGWEGRRRPRTVQDGDIY